MSPAPLQIIAFDFATAKADSDALMRAWVPEIEEAARIHVPDDRFVAFLVAALRLGAQSKNLDGFSLMQIVNKAGYSRSTFFRLFEGYTGFLLKGYQTMCALSARVFAKHLLQREMTLDEFCKFTADVFYGANCTIPPEICQMLWGEHDLPHAKFHPHLRDVAQVIADYLESNPPTQHLNLGVDELTDLVRDLDLVLLNARLESDPQLGTPRLYMRLRRMLKGYLESSV
jgi:AcrR family transcriptional regulator